jgi:hypothetical protein
MTTAIPPATNGTAHRRNGHLPAPRRGTSPPPLETVSTVGQKDAELAPEAARKPPADGRTAQGTFAKGNTFGRGNPNARRMAALRSALVRCLDEDKLACLGDKLYAAALGGDWAAAKILLAYALGKPGPAADADRLDLDECHILDAAPTLAQMLRAFLHSCDPKDAAELFQAIHPPNTEELRGRLAAGLQQADEAGRQGKPCPLVTQLRAEECARVGK